MWSQRNNQVAKLLFPGTMTEFESPYSKNQYSKNKKSNKIKRRDLLVQQSIKVPYCPLHGPLLADSCKLVGILHLLPSFSYPCQKIVGLNIGIHIYISIGSF